MIVSPPLWSKLLLKLPSITTLFWEDFLINNLSNRSKKKEKLTDHEKKLLKIFLVIMTACVEHKRNGGQGIFLETIFNSQGYYKANFNGLESYQLDTTRQVNRLLDNTLIEFFMNMAGFTQDTGVNGLIFINYNPINNIWKNWIIIYVYY